EDRASPLILLTLPIWCNVHPGWIFGFLLIALFAVADVCREAGRIRFHAIGRWAAIGLPAALLTLVNPYGWRLHANILYVTQATEITLTTSEFRSPDFNGSASQFLYYLPLYIGLTAFVSGRYVVLSWLLLVSSTYLSLQAGRHIAIFAVVATPFAALGYSKLLE